MTLVSYILRPDDGVDCNVQLVHRHAVINILIMHYETLIKVSRSRRLIHIEAPTKCWLPVRLPRVTYNGLLIPYVTQSTI